jgi:hypothetical protein
MRETVRRLEVLILVVALLPAASIAARAEPASIDDAIIEEVISRNARQNVLSVAARRAQLRRRCTPWKRALAGGAVGAVIGMVAVHKIAESYDVTAGMKTKLHAGGYGGAIGMVVGLATCR